MKRILLCGLPLFFLGCGGMKHVKHVEPAPTREKAPPVKTFEFPQRNDAGFEEKREDAVLFYELKKGESSLRFWLSERVKNELDSVSKSVEKSVFDEEELSVFEKMVSGELVKEKLLEAKACLERYLSFVESAFDTSYVIDVLLTELNQPVFEENVGFASTENKFAAIDINFVLRSDKEMIRTVVSHEASHVADFFGDDLNADLTYRDPFEVYSVRELYANVMEELFYLGSMDEISRKALLEFEIRNLPSTFSRIEKDESEYLFVQRVFKREAPEKPFQYIYSKNIFISKFAVRYLTYHMLKKYSIDEAARIFADLMKGKRHRIDDFDEAMRNYDIKDGGGVLTYRRLLDVSVKAFERTGRGERRVIIAHPYENGKIGLNFMNFDPRQADTLRKIVEKTEPILPLWFGDANNDGLYDFVVFSYDIDKDGGIDAEFHYPLKEKLRAKQVKIFGHLFDPQRYLPQRVKRSKYPYGMTFDLNNTDIFAIGVAWPFFDVVMVDNASIGKGYEFTKYPDGKIDRIKYK